MVPLAPNLFRPSFWTHPGRLRARQSKKDNECGADDLKIRGDAPRVVAGEM
jgi:hypothetical protein